MIRELIQASVAAEAALCEQLQRVSPRALLACFETNRSISGNGRGTVNVRPVPFLSPAGLGRYQGLKSIDVYVDGSRFASANFGLSRPNVAIQFPGAPQPVYAGHYGVP